jgi:glycerol kinase
MSIEQREDYFYCYLFERYGTIVVETHSKNSIEKTPEGWLHFDPKKVFQTVVKIAKEALERSGKTYRDINALGISVQRGSTVVWNAKTGEPVYGGIPWNCGRNSGLCRQLANSGYEKKVRDCCGTPIDYRFSGTKLTWILENNPDLKQSAQAGELLFGSMDSWLIWNFTKGKTHACDCSNAAFTMMYDIYNKKWDKDLLSALNIPAAMLPEVKLSSFDFGDTGQEYFGGPIKIACAAGNHNSALFGITCYDLGKARANYGYECDVMLHTGLSPVVSKSNLLTTYAYGIAGINKYALELPYIGKTGGAAPCENEFANTALENMAYLVYDVLQSAQDDAKCPIDMLYADGDVSNSDFLLQFQADILQTPVCRPVIKETSALGNAYIAGVFTGFYKGRDDVLPYWKAEKVFEPAISPGERDVLVEKRYAALNSIN